MQRKQRWNSLKTRRAVRRPQASTAVDSLPPLIRLLYQSPTLHPTPRTSRNPQSQSISRPSLTSLPMAVTTPKCSSPRRSGTVAAAPTATTSDRTDLSSPRARTVRRARPTPKKSETPSPLPTTKTPRSGSRSTTQPSRAPRRPSCWSMESKPTR